MKFLKWRLITEKDWKQIHLRLRKAENEIGALRNDLEVTVQAAVDEAIAAHIKARHTRKKSRRKSR